MSETIKRLSNKYFVKEDDGKRRINRKAVKETAGTIAFDVVFAGFAVVGCLAVVGLATIGVRTIRLGATTIHDGTVHVIDKLK